MKRYVLKEGDILEVPLSEKRYGYVRVIGKDEFGTMFQIFKGLFKAPIDESEFDNANLPTEAAVYVNSYAAKSSWKLRFRKKPGIEEMPKSFYGSPDRWWFIKDGDKIEKISPKSVTYDELLAAGHVHKALWLPSNVEKLLDSGARIRWTRWA